MKVGKGCVTVCRVIWKVEKSEYVEDTLYPYIENQRHILKYAKNQNK